MSPEFGSGCLVTDAQAVRDARAEILDEDVSPVYELMSFLLAFCGLQVQYHRAFAAVPGGEGRLTAGWVAAGALDLDDVCALLRQEHAQQWAGDVLPELHDTDSAKSALRFNCSSVGVV